MSIKKAKEFMEKFGEKFTPIKIDDEKLIKNVEEIKEERMGLLLTLTDLIEVRNENHSRLIKWFDKVIEKYDIPEKYNKKLVYNHKEKEIRLR